MSLPFRDRHDAGRQLGEKLFAYTGRSTVVLGIPRGGVPIAYGIAHALHAPLDVFLVRHLAPEHEPEAVFGAVGSGGVRVVRQDAARRLGLGQNGIDAITQRERISLLARERTYRGHLVESDLHGQVLILADDGSASETELKETIELLWQHDPLRVVLAVPVLQNDVAIRLAGLVDDIVAVARPEQLGLLERWYLECLPISHTEVRALLSLSLAEAQSRELAGIGEQPL
jgi:putative phosphoribosyl transferase